MDELRDTQYNLPIGTDMIDRQQAIDTLCRVDEYNGRSIEAIRQLPSAQTEIVKCKNCKHWIPYDWMFSEVWRSKNIADYPEDEIGCNFCDVAMKANDFCSRGERRMDRYDPYTDKFLRDTQYNILSTNLAEVDTDKNVGTKNRKKILDMTCGSRTIWFNKRHPLAVYCDKRKEDFELYFGKAHTSLHTCHVDPDVQCDFTDLPFEDNTFSLVVFDPPHLTGAKDTAWLVKKYGKLDDTWPQMLHDGFAEGMRVLKTDGVLIFKWSEYDIPADKVWKAIGQKPLFGHHSGKKSNTFWGVFMKGEE